jgi:acyl carrier protein
MQTQSEVMEKIIEILTDRSPKNIEIKEETDLVADLDLDSLKVMGILENLEDSFDISIPINILPDVRTIGDLVHQIENLIGKD